MKKEQLKAQLTKLKEKSREGGQKIRKIVIERKEDFLTILEKNWRDWSLEPLTGLLYKIGVTANHISYLGIVLVAVAIWMRFQDYSLLWQFIILALAAISDLLDGPMARNNDNVTIRGTWLDHIRDGCLVIWASYLIYKFNLLGLETLLIIWVLQIMIVWVDSKDFFIRYLKGLPAEQEEFFVSKFSLDNLQASIISRMQFFCWTTSYGFLFLSLLVSCPILITIGQALIVLEIIFAALNVRDCYQKSLS